MADITPPGTPEGGMTAQDAERHPNRSPLPDLGPKEMGGELHAIYGPRVLRSSSRVFVGELCADRFFSTGQTLFPSVARLATRFKEANKSRR